MLMLKSTPIFVIACCFANLIALFAAAFLATALMPADFLNQLFLVVPVFLAVASALVWLLVRMSQGKTWRPMTQGRFDQAFGKVVLGVVALNTCIFAAGFSAIFTGVTTPSETLFAGCTLMAIGFSFLRAKHWAAEG